jgi:hypothetical protein
MSNALAVQNSTQSSNLVVAGRQVERACSDMGPLDESRRQAAAARIMHLAQTGERDFEALRKYATASNLGRRRLPRLDQIFLSRRFSMADAV